MTTRFKEYREKLLADPEVHAAYDALEEEYTLARALIQARQMSGLTQAELADRMGTTQSVIARLESGKRLPSCQTLQRLAQATDTTLSIRFVRRGSKKRRRPSPQADEAALA
jgi:transcriptional regulator with XRE-family HTH domain